MDLAQLLNKELSLDKLSKTDRENIIARFGETLLKRIIFSILKLLSEDDRKELEMLGGDEAKINKFLTEKIHDIDKIREEEANLLMHDFKEFVEATK